MKTSEAFPSRTLSAADVKAKPLMGQISHIDLEEFKDSEGKMKSKPVVYFVGDNPKALVLNRVNCNTIEEAYGDEMDEWTGKSIVMFWAKVQFGSKMVEAIRVRMPKGKPDKISSGPLPKKPTPKHSDEVELETENPAADMDDEVPF